MNILQDSSKRGNFTEGNSIHFNPTTRRGNMKIYLSLLLSWLFFILNASASTQAETDANCPLCQHTFKTTMDMSGTQNDMRLDLKPLGAIAAPWRVPVCPKCHFVIFDQKLPQAELDKCKVIVAGEAFKKLDKRASYHLLGRLFEGLEKPAQERAFIFLKASWQEEEEAAHLKENLELSLKYFDLFLKEVEAQPKPEVQQQVDTALLVKGELLRRLGRFDEAKTHFTNLLTKKDFKDSFPGKLAAFQIQLCDNKDDKIHRVSELKQP
ncbi:MAG: hypothetical protein RL095_2048 [Verrucomicrobiota bacterium]|jgi:uncharacterized protein (DUF2225 family)